MPRFEGLRRRLAIIRSSFEPFHIYWSLYGGLRGLILSPYVWAAALLTWLCAPLWLQFDPVTEVRPATDLVMSIVPALMGFTLAGMAIVLALSGRVFVEALREGGDPKSLFMKVVVVFFHFLMVQTIALIGALISRSYPASDQVAGAVFFMMAYGLMSAVAIAAALLNVSRIYNLAGGSD